MSCSSDFARQALQLGTLIKHNSMRQWSLLNELNMPLAVRDRFYLQYTELKHIMEATLELALPKKTYYACAHGYDDTDITHVFYNKCTRQNCICGHDSYSFLRHQGESRRTRRNKSLTWRQLESLLFVVDMHKNILDMSKRFSESVIQLCKTEKKKFAFGHLDQNRLKATISKQDRLTRTMLKAIRSVTASWGKVLWAKVRRWVRMHHYAHKLWEYKFSSRVVQIDMENGENMIQNLL